MRREFGMFMYELMKRDDRVVLICGDIGYSIFDSLRADPLTRDRFINIGICEQSMISAAAGMSLEGLKPWVYTITPFLIERPFEQIKIDIDQMNTNVKLVGYADYPHQGPTHAEVLTPQVLGEAEILPNIAMHTPYNSQIARRIFEEESQRTGPAYISLKTNPEVKL
jgi:transketolase